MSIAVILLIFLICLKIRFCRPSEFFVEYMSIDNTNTIKGIFVLLVFISHFSGYIQISDPLYDVLQQKSGQLIVTCFLFYSGFGIHESLVRKGSKYVLSMPKKRMLIFCIAFTSTCPSTTIYTVRRCGFRPVENYTAGDLLLQRLKCRSLLTWDYFRVASRLD